MVRRSDTKARLDRAIIAVPSIIAIYITIYGVLESIRLLSGHRDDVFGAICVVGMLVLMSVAVYDTVLTYVHVRDPDVSRRLILMRWKFGEILLFQLLVWALLSIPALIYRINKNIG